MPVEMDISIHIWCQTYILVYGQDMYLFYQEYKKLVDCVLDIDWYNIGTNDLNIILGYQINIKYANQVYEALSRVRHPERYNLQMVQKNTEALEKLQYQVHPGKYFMDLMREQFPEASPFDITKMVTN